MPLADLTRNAVLDAIAEFDALGRNEFLGRYGFRPARSYFLEHDGYLYDSKAIAGVAHKFVRPNDGPLAATSFSGGEATVVEKLQELGFVVTAHTDDKNSDGRNPPWTRDELILALELYLRNPQSPPGKVSKEVAELSVTLNLLGQWLGRNADDKYRNKNGVYMKMMNFRRFDPAATSEGRVGLTRGNKEEEVIWNEFAHSPAHLKHVARAIAAALHIDQDLQSEPSHNDDGFCEAPEGRVLTRLHITRERNRKLVEKKKSSELARTGHLVCEVCNFDFEARYGERGRGFIEVHHTKPVHVLDDGATTKLCDLALVCANCHRMIHSARPWLELEELRALLRGV